MTDRYDPDDNMAKGYELGIRACHEICIRRGIILPERGNKEEQRWAREGDRKPSQLDSVKEEK